VIRPLIDDVVLLAIPYGDTGTTARGLERYARGAFRPEDFVGLPLMYRHNEPIGHIRDAVERPEGIVVLARFGTSDRALEVLQHVDERTLRGVSAGFVETVPAQFSHDRSRVAVIGARPLEVTITPTPAYARARVLGVIPGTESTPPQEAAA
jgi:phage head maturation protease